MKLPMRLMVGTFLAIWTSTCFSQPPSNSVANGEFAHSVIPNEGKVAVFGGNVWYRIVGLGKGTPLLVLHGGPGIPSDYLQPLEALGDERPVIFYDQLGCGQSDRPDDTKLWNVERFVEELAEVRKTLGLETVHLFGHSWGAMLAVDYLLTKPKGVKGLILASPVISTPRFIEDQKKYRAALPRDVQDVLNRHEGAGTTNSKEFEEATMVFYKRHLCRIDPFPDAQRKALAGAGWPVYHAMWGPTEFIATGNLKDYDRSGRLRELQTPTLFTCGFYDEAAPETTRHFQSLLPGSELVVFQRSAHMAHLEETDEYLMSVRRFLERVDKARPAGSDFR